MQEQVTRFHSPHHLAIYQAVSRSLGTTLITTTRRTFHNAGPEGLMGRTWICARRSKRPHPAKRRARRMRPHPPKYASHHASVLGSAFSVSKRCARGLRTKLTPIQSKSRERIKSRTTANIKPFPFQSVWMNHVKENNALLLSYMMRFVLTRFFAKDVACSCSQTTPLFEGEKIR